MPDICKTHCVMNCPLCKNIEEDKTSPQNRQEPPVEPTKPELKNEEARTVLSAADRYAQTCEYYDRISQEVERLKKTLEMELKRQVIALEEKHSAKKELVKLMEAE